MKTYKVYRRVAGKIPMLLYDHITDLQRAEQYANDMKQKTRDECYVVEYVSKRVHPRRKQSPRKQSQLSLRELLE